MQLLWRLRSPFSGQVSECHVIERSKLVYELRIVIQGGEKSATAFSSINEAIQMAGAVAGALRADGWADASEDEQPA